MSEYEFNHRQIWHELYDPDFPGDCQVVSLYPLENTVRTRTPLPFQLDDGGRATAAFQSRARDCVTRSIATATGLPYQRVYQDIARGNAAQKATSKIWILEIKGLTLRIYLDMHNQKDYY